MTTKNIVILGSTGSIGRQALEVIAEHPDRWRVVGLAAGSDDRALDAQVTATKAARSGLGAEAAIELATLPEADIVLNAIVGAAGLRASVAALGAGKTLALANKESLVAGGHVCTQTAVQAGGSIVPVDSEHAALAQALQGIEPNAIGRIVLTASGGPFRTRTDLEKVSVDEALAHPTWTMGPKITVDCATMMNKGLEVIAAHYLFDFDYDQIDVVVHPQSIVHGIVELVDGSMIMQGAPADMRIPIQAALAHPDRPQGSFGRVDLTEVGHLDFEKVDYKRFPCVALAYEAARMGGSYPAVLNAANEEAVNAFLGGHTPFTGIAQTIADVMDRHDGAPADDLDGVIENDLWARREAQATLQRRTEPRGALA